ncbi:MAG: 1-acyl-sn-glycerol-3-phosphate acyltransferase [Saprospiraceae bacterium]
MTGLFSNIFEYFKKRQGIFWLLFVSVFALLAMLSFQIKIEEDITRFFPDDPRVNEMNYVFKNASFSEQITCMVTARDSSKEPNPDLLTEVADTFAAQLQAEISSHISKINLQVEDSQIQELIQGILDHLPLFLSEQDYLTIDSVTKAQNIPRVLQGSYQQLVSPVGWISKDILLRDPLGLSYLVLAKLKQLKVEEQFELYDNYLCTKDQNGLLFFLFPKYPATNTSQNIKLFARMDEVVANLEKTYPSVQVSYFGAPAVAAANARQMRQDTIWTTFLLLVLISSILFAYFRRKRVPLLIFIPVLFGICFSLAGIYLIQGSVSILALAAGSVVLGIAVNYSLHFFVHLRYEGDRAEVIRSLVKPLTIGSLTTVLAFIALQFTNAPVLRDIGLFAGFSLVGAALCTLIFLPHLIPDSFFKSKSSESNKKPFLAKLLSSKYTILLIAILTPVFFYFANDVRFNSDLSALNYMDEDLKKAETQLMDLSQSSLNSLFIASSGSNMEEALRNLERTMPVVEKLKAEGKIQKIHSIADFIISDSLQRVRIERWNSFWSDSRKQETINNVRIEGSKLRFSDKALNNYDSLISKQYQPVDTAYWTPFKHAFFEHYLIEKPGKATVLTIVNADKIKKDAIYQEINKTESKGFDRQLLANIWVEYVHEDFNFILLCTALLVFFALLISYGRIELTIITFLPMLITWIWILGIMALLDIEFNIVNIMVSTFIFGLGDDYSIFTMDGLQQDFARGKKHESSIRTSIFLSAITTIIGLGVLIFAQHPAMRSIATISIIGILCVLFMSQTIEPFLFKKFISDRAKKGYAPYTLKGFVITFYTYTLFIVGSLILTLIGFVLLLIPIRKKEIKLFFHKLIQNYTKALLWLGISASFKFHNKTDSTFNSSGVVIANHSSFMDILLSLIMSPRLILMTNKWVWNSPIFGGLVRLADFYPVMSGAESSTQELADRAQEGYSIVVFPEGTRSVDGKIKRFHKGAFYLADALQIPIRPLMIHGASDMIRKGDLLINDGRVTLRFLPDIMPNNLTFGRTYSERTKNISKYFKANFALMKQEIETPEYFRKRLISNYIFKDPVLEWYARIKIKLEKNYAIFHELIPLEAKVLDIGCGYGFLCYMLHFLSEERQITGLDYDTGKIEIANHCFSKSKELSFYAEDIMSFDFEQYDAIVIADVLHYLSPAQQESVLRRCFAALLPDGKLIIRDGDADLVQRHKGTKLTELFSVKIFGFNKSNQSLHFLSGKWLRKFASDHKMKVQEIDESKLTSNTIFVLQSEE